MKRYHLFPLFTGFAAVVLLAASCLISPASASEQVYSARFELSVADFEKTVTIYAAPAALSTHEGEDAASWRSSLSAAPVLHPDYAESLKTDALNFVETRLRC